MLKQLIKKKILPAKNFFGILSKPSFMIIGVEKGGTSSLFSILNQHSMLAGSSEKELHYFDNRQYRYNKEKIYDYHACFPLKYKLNKGSQCFEATPNYLCYPPVAQHLHSYNKNLKFILLLRNPAYRALSSWAMYHYRPHPSKDKFKHLRETRSFKQMVSEELNCINKVSTGSFLDRRHIARGLYYNQISNYLKYFNVDQMLFIESDELRKQFDKTIVKVCDFLGVDHEKLENKFLHTSIVDNSNKYHDELNLLKQFYHPYNLKLYSLLGKEYDWG